MGKRDMGSREVNVPKFHHHRSEGDISKGGMEITHTLRRYFWFYYGSSRYLLIRVGLLFRDLRAITVEETHSFSIITSAFR